MLPVEYLYGGPVGSKGWGPNSPSGASPRGFATTAKPPPFRVPSNRRGTVSLVRNTSPRPARHGMCSSGLPFRFQRRVRGTCFWRGRDSFRDVRPARERLYVAPSIG